VKFCGKNEEMNLLKILEKNFLLTAIQARVVDVIEQEDKILINVATGEGL